MNTNPPAELIETIKTNVAKNPAWAGRAIIALYDRQTQDEQQSEQTVHKNGMGFSGADAEILSSFARQIRQGRSLSPKQLAIAFKRLPKYAKQLAIVAQERAQ